MAVIDEIVENRLDAKALSMGEYLRARLEGLKKYGVVREVRGKGILLGVEFVKDTTTLEPFPELGTALKKTALKNGVILRIDPCWFAVAPALIASESELDEMCGLIEKSLVEAMEQVTQLYGRRDYARLGCG
jgi:4-aminobutyrate aminotransferase-like enzyme